MAQGIESGVGGVWQTQQTTPGTRERSDAVGMRRMRKTGDEGLSAAKTTASEEYVDGEFIGTPTVYVDTIGGDVGSLGFQGQIETCAFLFAQALSADVVTGVADPWTHTIVSGRNAPEDQTIYQEVGNTVSMRQVFYDAKIGRLTYNAGQDQKVVRMTEGIQALKVAEWFTTSPTAVDVGSDPLRWDQAVTRINGTELPEIRGDMVEYDASLGVERGQTGHPVCFSFGKGAITSTLETFTTDGTLPEVKRAIYGTNAPADRAAVSNDVIYAAFETTYTAVAARRTLTITRPRVEIRGEDWAFGPRAEGGIIPVAFGGRCLKADSSTPIIRVVALTGDEDPYWA